MIPMGMDKRALVTLFILSSTIPLIITSEVQFIHAQTYQTITIGADGSVVPVTELLEHKDKVYSLTGNISGRIVVKADNIVIDGAGYTLEGNEIEGNGTGIDLLSGPNNVTISNIRIKGFINGITLSGSNNVLTGCTLTDCSRGISLYNAFANTISDNNVDSNKIGFGIDYSSNNAFMNNRLNNNTTPIAIGEEAWFNSLDSSNSVDSKPIYYLVNKKDLVISPFTHPEIGYLALVNCTNITVKNLHFFNSTMSGMVLAYTTKSTITQNTITNLTIGIYLYECSNSSITDNYLANMKKHAIYIKSTSTNVISGNNIENNHVGVYLEGANQVIYHNNFLNNSKHADASEWDSMSFVPLPNGMHLWDNGYPLGGNYWSDYTGTDANSDGIGDTPYIVSQYRNNTDPYPLISRVNVSSSLQDSLPSVSPSPTQQPTSVLSASLAESASALDFGNKVNFTVSVGGGKAPYTFAWYMDNSLVQTTNSPYFSTDNASVGAHHVHVKVTDSTGDTAETLTVEFNVLPNPNSTSNPSPSPSVAEFPTWVVLPLLMVTFVGVVLGRKFAVNHK
jgi:parallel beta-helix repeat protein